MDEAESGPEESGIARAKREYTWFAITLLCIMTLVVIQSHT
jgi:hypothetical protein